jgi:Tol biopolymer transport system component
MTNDRLDRRLPALLSDIGRTDAAGLLEDVLDATGSARQRPAWRHVGWWLPEVSLAPRRAVLIGVVGLLLIALIAVVVGAGSSPDRPLPVEKDPSTVVVQQWNGLRDPALRVSQTAYPPGSAIGTRVMESLPRNAVGLRWSPDGSRLAFWLEEAPPNQHSLELTGLFLAGSDGTDPVEVALPRGTDQYTSNGWWSGVHWAPTGARFALAWDTHGCTGGANCIPPGGIDVFDATGQQTTAISILDSPLIDPVWSPDGLAVGWMSGSCANSLCEDDAFHWRRVDDGATVTTLLLDRGSVVSWSDANRLQVVVMRDGFTFVDRVYSMTPDGTDIREVPWTDQAQGLSPMWSPHGRLLAWLQGSTGTFTVYDTVSGAERRASLPVNIGIAAWAPASDALVLYGSSDADPQGYALYVIAADGTGFTSLANGDDFAWMPAEVAIGP